jgi:hypothetical protein
MCTPEDDLFYQRVDSADWKLVFERFSAHEFPNCRKVVKAYGNFNDFISVGKAMTSRLDLTDNSFLKLMKTGFYGAMYLAFKDKRER